MNFLRTWQSKQNTLNGLDKQGEMDEALMMSMARNKHVVVVGGGDTGNDCIGTSLRQVHTTPVLSCPVMSCSLSHFHVVSCHVLYPTCHVVSMFSITPSCGVISCFHLQHCHIVLLDLSCHVLVVSCHVFYHTCHVKFSVTLVIYCQCHVSYPTCHAMIFHLYDVSLHYSLSVRFTTLFM